MDLDSLEKRLQDASKDRENKLRRAGLPGRVQVGGKKRTLSIQLGWSVTLGAPLPPLSGCAPRTYLNLPPAARLQMAIQLTGLDADVLALSRQLAVRTLQLEMEHVYRSLEDEALDMTTYDSGVASLGEQFVCFC